MKLGRCYMYLQQFSLLAHGVEFEWLLACKAGYVQALVVVPERADFFAFHLLIIAVS